MKQNVKFVSENDKSELDRKQIVWFGCEKWNSLETSTKIMISYRINLLLRSKKTSPEFNGSSKVAEKTF